MRQPSSVNGKSFPTTTPASTGARDYHTAPRSHYQAGRQRQETFLPAYHLPRHDGRHLTSRSFLGTEENCNKVNVSANLWQKLNDKFPIKNVFRLGNITCTREWWWIIPWICDMDGMTDGRTDRQTDKRADGRILRRISYGWEHIRAAEENWNAYMQFEGEGEGESFE